MARASKNASGRAPAGPAGASARKGRARGEPAQGASARDEAILRALDTVRGRCDVEQRRAADPVEFVHGYPDPSDREIVALLASSLAFGNVKALRAKIRDALDRLGPDIARVADDPALVGARLRGWKHRVYRDADLAGLLVGARRVQRASGSLGQALASEIQRTIIATSILGL